MADVLGCCKGLPSFNSPNRMELNHFRINIIWLRLLITFNVVIYKCVLINNSHFILLRFWHDRYCVCVLHECVLHKEREGRKKCHDEVKVGFVAHLQHY